MWKGRDNRRGDNKRKGEREIQVKKMKYYK